MRRWGDVREVDTREPMALERQIAVVTTLPQLLICHLAFREPLQSSLLFHKF